MIYLGYFISRIASKVLVHVQLSPLNLCLVHISHILTPFCLKAKICLCNFSQMGRTCRIQIDI
jgi:hypothetical protein